MACSFGGMPLAPMALERTREKINQNTAQVLALLQLHTNSLPYDVGEDLAGAPFVGGFYG
jgi:hypothetical protein